MRLLDVDDARPVDEELVVLGRLVARRFRCGDDRKPLLHVGELNLERLAREGHVLLRRRDVSGKPEEEVRARHVGERIALDPLAAFAIFSRAAGFAFFATAAS